MKELIRKAKQLALLLLVISFVGCEDDDAELPKVIAGFTYTLNENTGTVTFINVSENASEFQWSFGDGDSSEEINPIKTYQTGEYTITLTATNGAGGEDTFEDTITIQIPLEIQFPIAFDNPLVDFNVTTFGGVAFEVVENPYLSGSNAVASNVGQITNSGATFEGFFFELGENLDLATQQTISVNFWSEVPIDVLLKLEQGTGPDVEVVASHGGTGWEILTFTFSSTDAYSQVTFFVDGPGTTSGTFFIDDITQIDTINNGMIEDCGGDLINDFETADDSIFSNFGGGVGTIIDNDETSVNSSAKLGQYVKNDGEVFGGITIALDSNIAFNAGTFSIDVRSSSVRQLLFKLEGLGIEKILPTSGEAWETITYDFSDVAGNMGDVTAITLIMDNGTAGDGSSDWTIQFDNIRLCANGDTGGDTGSIADCGGDLVNDFETADDSIFNNFGGGVGTIIDNPDTSINMSAKLAQYVKGSGEVFAGITIGLDNNIAFNAGTFSIDVKSSAVRQLLFKLEGLGIEKILPTAGSGWETITYDFADVAGNMGDVTGITLIMDNGTAGDGSEAWTIQFDNIRLCTNGDGGGGMPFDDGLLVNGDFQTLDTNGNVTEWIQGVDDTNPAPVTTEGDNTFYSINVTSPTPGQPFNINVSQKLEIINGETYTLSFDAWSDVNRSIIAGIGLSGGDFSNNSEAVNITTERLTYQLTLLADGFGAPDARVLFDLADEAGVVNIDNVSLFIDSGSGGGGGGGTGDCPAPPAGDFIADGDFEANSSCWALFDNGGAASISATVSNGGGTRSGQITSGTGANPGIKQERFGIGTVMPNTTYVVSFDIKADASDPLADGAILNAFMFSEPAEGSTDPAVQHVLVQADGAVSTNWETRTYTFTTAASVGGGVSFLIELVCGGAATCGGTINIDNVSMTAQ